MSLTNKKIIALVSDDFEDLELWYPVYRLREAGAIVDLVGEEANKEYIGKYGVPAVSNFDFKEIKKEDYDG
ncbi:MAG: DJ-1/PfpI family protein, partial [Carnobacterium sp.]